MESSYVSSDVSVSIAGLSSISLKSVRQDIRDTRSSVSSSSYSGSSSKTTRPWSSGRSTNPPHEGDEDPWRKPLILSLDGGGIKGSSTLAVVNELMEAVRRVEGLENKAKPCLYFDYIVGTGTGGLLAIMLGRLRMTVEECIEAYGRLADDLFPSSRRGALRRFRREYKTRTLETSINQIVQDYAPAARQCGQEDIFASDPLQCKTACVSFDVKTGKPFVFRTYGLSSSNDKQAHSRKIGLTEPHAGLPCICDAARATSASPTYFTPFKLGQRTHFDGGLTSSNPSLLIYSELRDLLRTPAQGKCGPAVREGSTLNNAIIEVFVSVGVAKHSKSTNGGKKDSTRTILRRNSDLFQKARSVLEQWDSISSNETDGFMRSRTTMTGDIASYFRLISNSRLPSKLQKDGQKSQERVPEEPAYRSLDVDRCAQELVRVKQKRQKTPRWSHFAGPLCYSQEQLSAESFSSPSLSASSSDHARKATHNLAKFSSFEYSSVQGALSGSENFEGIYGLSVGTDDSVLVDSMSSKTCTYFWRVPEFFKELKSPAQPDCFDNIVTLSRICGDKYWACTCLSFIESCWPEFGSSVLRIVSRICQVLSESRVFHEAYITCGAVSFNARATEFYLRLEPVSSQAQPSGTLESPEPFQRLVDCVRWLICALMPSGWREGLFRTNMVTIDDAQTYVMAFKSFKASPDHAHCWTKMFCYAHIIDLGLYANRSSLPTAALSKAAKDEPPGLKLDYGLLWELAGIERASPYDGGLVLNGFDTALAPLEAGDWPNYSRWHLWRTPGKRIEIQKLSLGRDREMTTELDKFVGKVVYVGWALESKVLLGTSLEAAVPDLKGSSVESVDRLSERAQDSLAVQLQQSLPHGGPAIAGQAQRVWNYQSTLIPASRLRQFELSLNEAKTRQVILYDEETQNATIVPELALLMFATLTYISHYRYTHFSQHSDPLDWQHMSGLSLPSRCYDIATESENVLLYHATTVVSKDDQGRGMVSFKEIVNAMTEILYRGSNSCRQEISKRRRSGKGALYGFDLREAILNEDIYFRRLKCTASMKAWAAAAEQTSVIFVNGLGGLIVPACEHEECLVTYPGLLSGTVLSLRTAFSRDRWRDNERHRRIKDTNFQWTIRGTPFLGCKHLHCATSTTCTASTICGDICRIQTMSQNSNFKAIFHQRKTMKRQLNLASASYAVLKGGMWSPRVWTDTCPDCDLKPKGAIRFGKVKPGVQPIPLRPHSKLDPPRSAASVGDSSTPRTAAPSDTRAAPPTGPAATSSSQTTPVAGARTASDILNGSPTTDGMPTLPTAKTAPAPANIDVLTNGNFHPVTA